MAGRFDNSNGSIIISTDVIANISGMAATQCYGVVGMASRNAADGLVSLLKKEAMTKGVKVVVEGQDLIIDLHIIVEYGVNISAVCESIINTVKYTVESTTGLVVKKINVFVESIRVE
ncbi:MAG: Asp23/Gls24 family envelope stress response protein [Clostridiaceae bacterium]|nr:Asp23/Gls24 family envelope stress response protein [Clostridiaceae bacterium]